VIDIDRVGDIELLRQVAKIQDAELKRVHGELRAKQRQWAELAGKTPEQIEAVMGALDQDIESTTQRVYGGGSERRPRKEGTPEKSKAPQQGHGPKAQPELLRTESIHTLDDADKACPDCGTHLKPWQDQFEDSEEVDIVDVQYVLRKHRRQKYRCACGHIETALGPEKTVPGGRYSTQFGVHVAVAKFADHLPLERQVKRMRRCGMDVDSQTLWDQTHALYARLLPVKDRLHAYLLQKEVICVDETRWPLLGTKGRKTKNWFVWSLTADDGVLYLIQDGRSNEEGEKILKNYGGVAVTDGYVVYSSLSTSKGFVLANCWAHARRKFIEAEPSAPNEAQAFLDQIGQLFGLEQEIDRQVATLRTDEAKTLRAQVRDERSRPVLQKIGEMAAEVRAPRESPIARAVRYLENRWEPLKVFLTDPRVPLTSNAVERSLRGPVLGRNNHFGSRSERGTQVAALMYSLIESAKLNGMDPNRYLSMAATAGIRGEPIPLPHELV
jgi:transposase